MAAYAEAAGPTVDNAPSISFDIIARSLHRAPFAPESGPRASANSHTQRSACARFVGSLDRRREAIELPPARFLV